MTSLLSHSGLSITLISGAFIMSAATVISPLPSAPALARPHAVPQTCVLMVPSTGQDDNPSRQNKAINVCIPTADIPLGTPSAAAQSGASDPRTVGAKTGYRTVGKFFFKVALVARFNCTGTVLTADNKKPALVLVAAHCLYGNLGKITYKTEDWSFAPGWHDNKAPYDTWKFSTGYYPAKWPFNCFMIHCDFNPSYDFALLIVKKDGGKRIGSVTGSDGWSTVEPKTISVRIAGIPGNKKETLISNTVSHTVKPHGVLARKGNTPGFGDGASGGPWFYRYDKRAQLGYVLGDTGGYQNGGDSDSPSYSPVWASYFAGFIAAVSKKEQS